MPDCIVTYAFWLYVFVVIASFFAQGLWGDHRNDDVPFPVLAIISPLILAVLAILSPFLLPFLAGKLIRKSLKKREQEKKRKEEQCSKESAIGVATNIHLTLARAAPDAVDRKKG